MDQQQPNRYQRTFRPQTAEEEEIRNQSFLQFNEQFLTLAVTYAWYFPPGSPSWYMRFLETLDLETIGAAWPQ